MRRSLVGCRAVITGASSGIGRALAIELASQGARLMLTARRDDLLRELVRRINQVGGTATSKAGDITLPEFREQLLENAMQTLTGVDALINNAGIGAIGDFATSEPSRLHSIMDLNFLGPAELTRLAIPLLAQGHSPIIVNIGSVLGHFAVPRKSEYCASKFALRGFSDALRAELAHRGIDVMLVSPSTTKTDFFDNVIEDLDIPKQKRHANSKYRRGTMTPEAVAKKVARAMRMGRDEIILSPGGRLLVWLDQILPALSRRLMARYG